MSSPLMTKFRASRPMIESALVSDSSSSPRTVHQYQDRFYHLTLTQTMGVAAIRLYGARGCHHDTESSPPPTLGPRMSSGPRWRLSVKRSSLRRRSPMSASASSASARVDGGVRANRDLHKRQPAGNAFGRPTMRRERSHIAAGSQRLHIAC
jgi:hypothetical protein